MARSRESKIELTAYDDLFQTDESREEAKLSKIRDIPIAEIDEFPDHPFKVLMDEDMEQLVDSIKRNGIMTPATVRVKEDGRYELISGHRRKSPVMAAIPAMFPCIMAGNVILVLCVALLKGKLGSKAGFPVSIVIGSILKGLFMGVVISLIILPNMLPEKMAPMLRVLQLQFSLTQVVTALIGGVYAFIIAAALRKTSLGKQD